MKRDSELVRWPDNVRGHPPPLSRTEKFARTELSGAKENKKRCPPTGSSGSTALIVWIFCGKEANDDTLYLKAIFSKLGFYSSTEPELSISEVLTYNKLYLHSFYSGIDHISCRIL